MLYSRPEQAENGTFTTRRSAESAIVGCSVTKRWDVRFVEECISKAAVECGDWVFTVPRPLRHDSALRVAYYELKPEGALGEVQGFLTSYGRFVDREEAAQIAFEAGQITKKKWELFSEDVW